MAIKFATNVPQTLIFPFGDFMEVNGQYGQQFLYTVEIDGQRDKLYATPNLHDQLQADGIAPGSVLTITKIEALGRHVLTLNDPRLCRSYKPIQRTKSEPVTNAQLPLFPG